MSSHDLLAVVVPYRNRSEHLAVFLDKFPKYMSANEPDIPYCIIISQQPEGLPFIRGLTINVGAVYAKQFNASNIFISDIDMIPIASNHSFVQKQQAKIRFPVSAGSCIVHIEDFFKSQGYNNEYVGWGAEDDEFYMRLHMMGVSLHSLSNDASLKYESLPHPHQFHPSLYGRNKALLEEFMSLSIENKKLKIINNGINSLDQYVTNIRHTDVSDVSVCVHYDILPNAYPFYIHDDHQNHDKS